MGSESHKLLREPLSLRSVRRGAELPSSLQGPKVTSVPSTHRRVGDRGPGSGREEEAAGETGLWAPQPLPEQRQERVA